MPNAVSKKTLDAARAALAHPMSFADFLARLSPKDRTNVERRIGVLEAEPTPHRVELWKRLTCALTTLAPHAAKFVGKQAVQFYIADGRYRMQAFALEDLQDGNTTVYCPDVLAEAIAVGLLAEGPEGNGPLYTILPAREPLHIEPLTGASLNPAAHYKDMVGWNRKAIQITLPPSASEVQTGATELLCAIAAQHFAKAAPVPAKQ